jgi:hypothetical protein
LALSVGRDGKESSMRDKVSAYLALTCIVGALLGSSVRASGQAREGSPISQSGQLVLEAKAISLGKLVEDTREETLTVSVDGKRFAYIAGKVEVGWPQPAHIWQTFLLPGAEPFHNLRVVVDGEKGPDHKAVGIFPVFSPDGRRVAYAAADRSHSLTSFLKSAATFPVRPLGLSERIVIDGTEGKHYDEVGTPVFSPDGRHVAYRAFHKNRWHMVVDNTEGDEYESMLNSPIFSPDNQRVSYIAGRGKKLLVVNGPQASEVSAPAGGYLVFSPDGRRLACVLVRGRQGSVYVDGVEGAAYDSIGVPVFTSDGRLA